MRQNIAEIDEIEQERGNVLVKLVPVERAIYLELDHHLQVPCRHGAMQLLIRVGVTEMPCATGCVSQLGRPRHVPASGSLICLGMFLPLYRPWR